MGGVRGVLPPGSGDRDDLPRGGVVVGSEAQTRPGLDLYRSLRPASLARPGQDKIWDNRQRRSNRLAGSVPPYMECGTLWTSATLDRLHPRVCSDSRILFGVPDGTPARARPRGRAFVLSLDVQTAPLRPGGTVCVTRPHHGGYSAVSLCQHPSTSAARYVTVCAMETERHTSIKLPESLHRELSKRAKANERTFSQEVRLALKLYVAKAKV